MKAKYQKYYDSLKGANLSSGLSTLSSAVSTSSNELSAIKGDSTAWNELGAQTFNDVTIPALIDGVSTLSSNITGALTQVVAKCTELLSALSELDSLEKELESLGSKWTYTEGGSKSKSEVNSHNNKIDELTKKIEEKESSIDGIIASINGISIETTNSSVTASGLTGADTNALDTSSAVTGTATPAKDGRIYNTDPVLNEKIKKIIGDVDDPNNYDSVPSNYRSMRKDILVIDCDTGETYNRDDVIKIKKGEKKRLIVKLPTNTGMIKQITRTTADNNGSSITKTYSDVNPDPNVVETVRRSSNKWPSDMSVLHNNSYEWIVEGLGTGSKTLSQTCEYNTDVSRGENLKAMTRIKFVIEDS